MITGFYSFKGGVGRTTAAVNSAMLLALKGKRIGLLDLDIEAPGVISALGLKALNGQSLLHVMIGGNIPFLDRVVVEYDLSHARQLGGNDYVSGGALLVVPSIPDPSLIDQVKWDAPATTWQLNEIVRYFIKRFRLDHLFIDARSGLSQSASYALSVAERVICFFRLNRQNIIGALQMLPAFTAKGRDFKIVLSEVPDGADAPQREEWIMKFEKETVSRVDFILPFDPSLLFEERLFVIEDPQSALSRALAGFADSALNTLEVTSV